MIENHENIFFARFSIKSQIFDFNSKNDFSQLSFEVYYVCVAIKLTILELGSKKFNLSYFNFLSYVFGEHKDSVVRGTTYCIIFDKWVTCEP